MDKNSVRYIEQQKYLQGTTKTIGEMFFGMALTRFSRISVKFGQAIEIVYGMCRKDTRRYVLILVNAL